MSELHDAALDDDLHLVELLLQGGADVNEQDYLFGTALSIAIVNNSIPFSKPLD